MFGGLGFTELFFIFVLALIIFGPRKLPELGKTLGNALGQFKRASEDFKRQWEDEVEVEKRRPIQPRPDPNALARDRDVPAPPSTIDAEKFAHASMPSVTEVDEESERTPAGPVT